MRNEIYDLELSSLKDKHFMRAYALFIAELNSSAIPNLKQFIACYCSIILLQNWFYNVSTHYFWLRFEYLQRHAYTPNQRKNAWTVCILRMNITAMLFHPSPLSPSTGTHGAHQNRFGNQSEYPKSCPWLDTHLPYAVIHNIIKLKYNITFL